MAISDDYYTDIDQWEIVHSFLDIQEGYMARAYLEAKEISTLLRDELSTQVSYFAPAIGGMKLLVRKGQSQEALYYLEEGGYIRRKKQMNEKCQVIEDPVTQDFCPFCHSDNITKEKIGWFRGFILHVMDILFMPCLPQWICFDCGKKWKFRITYRRKES